MDTCPATLFGSSAVIRPRLSPRSPFISENAVKSAIAYRSVLEPSRRWGLDRRPVHSGGAPSVSLAFDQVRVADATYKILSAKIEPTTASGWRCGLWSVLQMREGL